MTNSEHGVSGEGLAFLRGLQYFLRSFFSCPLSRVTFNWPPSMQCHTAGPLLHAPLSPSSAKSLIWDFFALTSLRASVFLVFGSSKTPLDI